MTLGVDSCPKDVIGRFWPASVRTILNADDDRDSRLENRFDHDPIGVHRNVRPNNRTKG
jgi:hypothetical protein